jgi:hypothetical protein
VVLMLKLKLNLIDLLDSKARIPWMVLPKVSPKLEVCPTSLSLKEE